MSQNLRRCKKINSRLKLGRKVRFDKTPYYYAFLLYPQRNVPKHLTYTLLFPFHWLIDGCRVSLCNPGCPWTHCHHFASSSPGLRLRTCTTQSKWQFFFYFLSFCECASISVYECGECVHVCTGPMYTGRDQIASGPSLSLSAPFH